jgi:hypothetical protein
MTLWTGLKDRHALVRIDRCAHDQRHEGVGVLPEQEGVFRDRERRRTGPAELDRPQRSGVRRGEVISRGMRARSQEIVAHSGVTLA